jgi:quinohemoprotein ethanol dehydrogenase
VFEHDGKQYVVAYSAGNVLVGTPHGDSVWLFALDGTLPPAEQGGAAAGGAESNGPALAAITGGKQLFDQVCAPCHGADGKGGHGGGAPLVNAKDATAVTRTVTDGRNNMPAFGTQLSTEQIRAVSSYIVNDLFK